MRRTICAALGVLLACSAVAATIVTLYANDSRWNTLNNVYGTGISSEDGVRSAGAFAMIGIYNRTVPEVIRIRLDQTIRVAWQDGTSEQIKFVCSTSPACARIVEGTQVDAGGSAGDGGSGDGGSGDYSGWVGGDPYDQCTSDVVNACVAIGDGEWRCENVSILDCPT